MPKWKALRRITYDILIQIIPVTLGVYLGIMASNRNEIRKEEALTRKVVNSLIREMNFNREELKASIPYFQQLRDSLAAGSEGAVRNPSDFTFWKGLNPPLPKSASYETAALTGILAKLDPDLVEQLTSSYNRIEDLEIQTDTYIRSVTDKIGNPDFDNRQYAIILENYAYDQLTAELSILNQLEHTLELLETGQRGL